MGNLCGIQRILLPQRQDTAADHLCSNATLTAPLVRRSIRAVIASRYCSTLNRCVSSPDRSSLRSRTNPPPPGPRGHPSRNQISYQSSVSTLLFNGNPLLRYDGYYVFSDILAIANLAQRSREYLYYVVKRYAWGLRQARSPTHTPSERRWMVSYGVASTIYRLFVCIAILLFVADKLFIVGTILAGGAIVTWVLAPLGRLLHYLASSDELTRVRARAVGSTLAVFVLCAIGLGVVPVPHHARAKGVVEPRRLAIVHVATDGFVERVLPSGSFVGPRGPALLVVRSRH